MRITRERGEALLAYAPAVLKQLALLAVLVLGGWSVEAAACTCRTPPMVVLPVDNSVGVPTNLSLLLGPKSFNGQAGVELRDGAEAALHVYSD